MKIKPVLGTPTPNYPDKYDEEMRRILAAAKPRRWAGTPLVGALSVVIALGLSGCVPGDMGGNAANGPPTHPILTPGTTDDYPTLGVPVTIYTPSPHDNIFIPLFEYGVGTGGIGCEAVIAPVFLSEEEAFAILAAAFADAGVTLGRGGGAIGNINLPVTNIDGATVEPNATTQGALDPAGMLEEHGLPVAFVSMGDVRSWHQDIGDGPQMSWNSFDIVGAARTLAENNPGIVVFYDPVEGRVDYSELWSLEREDGESEEDYHARWAESIRELEQAARTESEDMLRRQIDAFIAWLEDWGF